MRRTQTVTLVCSLCVSLCVIVLQVEEVEEAAEDMQVVEEAAEEEVITVAGGSSCSYPAPRTEKAH